MNMKAQIIYTTDGKYIGEEIETNKSVVRFLDTSIELTKLEYIQDQKLFILSNSNYVIHAKEI